MGGGGFVDLYMFHILVLRRISVTDSAYERGCSLPIGNSPNIISPYSVYQLALWATDVVYPT